VSPFVGIKRCYLGGGRRFSKLAKFGTIAIIATTMERTTLFFDI